MQKIKFESGNKNTLNYRKRALENTDLSLDGVVRLVDVGDDSGGEGGDVGGGVGQGEALGGRGQLFQGTLRGCDAAILWVWFTSLGY